MDIQEELRRLAGRRGLNEPDAAKRVRIAADEEKLAERLFWDGLGIGGWFPFGRKAKGEGKWETWNRKQEEARAKEARAEAKVEAREAAASLRFAETSAARKRKLARNRKRKQRARARRTVQ